MATFEAFSEYGLQLEETIVYQKLPSKLIGCPTYRKCNIQTLKTLHLLANRGRNSLNLDSYRDGDSSDRKCLMFQFNYFCLRYGIAARLGRDSGRIRGRCSTFLNQGLERNNVIM